MKLSSEVDRFFTRCHCCGESFRTDRPGDRYCYSCVRYCDVECRIGSQIHHGGYILAEGEGKAVAIYSRCEDPLLARAELLLTMENARTGRLGGGAVMRGRDVASLDLRRAPIWGLYDEDRTFTIEEFLDAYRQGDKFSRFLSKLGWLRTNGWKFNHAPSKETPMVRHISDIVTQVENILKEYATGAKKEKKAALYVREIPAGLPEIKDIYLEDKWRGFDKQLDQPEIEAIFVMYPDVLGDTHVELLANLSKIAKRGIALYMHEPSPFLKGFGEVQDDG